MRSIRARSQDARCREGVDEPVADRIRAWLETRACQAFVGAGVATGRFLPYLVRQRRRRALHSGRNTEYVVGGRGRGSADPIATGGIARGA